MLMVLLFAVDFGRVFMGWINVHNMARIGANYAAINATAWQAPDSTEKANKRQRYQTLMMKDAEASGCALTSPLPAPVFGGYTLRSTVRVEIVCDFQLVTPLLATLIGDADGNLEVGAGSTFDVRSGGLDASTVGGSLPTAAPTPSPPPTNPPTATPEPTPPPATPEPGVTPDPSATPTPTAEPTPTVPLVTVDFYGTPTSTDSEGGGPNPSPGFENIVGVPTLSVTFKNTTRGDQWWCVWDFGDGTTTNSCSTSVSKSYNVRGVYHVSLTVNGQQLIKAGYVTVACKVPAFSGVRKNSAPTLWTAAGFTADNLSFASGSGNYVIGSQTLAGGMINPPGGCEGATITVGP